MTWAQVFFNPSVCLAHSKGWYTRRKSYCWWEKSVFHIAQLQQLLSCCSPFMVPDGILHSVLNIPWVYTQIKNACTETDKKHPKGWDVGQCDMQHTFQICISFIPNTLKLVYWHTLWHILLLKLLCICSYLSQQNFRLHYNTFQIIHEEKFLN